MANSTIRDNAFRYVQLFDTVTDVTTDTTITMDAEYTMYSMLVFIFNTRSGAPAGTRMTVTIPYGVLPYGAFYPVGNQDATGLVQLTNVSGDNTKVRVASTTMPTLYLARILGLK